MSKIQTKWIEDAAVTKDKLNADVAGSGITQAVGGELDVNVDGTTLEVATDTVQVKALGIDSAQLAATSVTAAKLGADVAGDGLTGGNGADLDVAADVTGGANLATAINVSANGVAVKVDDDTIGENGSSQLYVKANSIGSAEIDETDNYAFTGSMDLSGASSVSVPTPTQDTHAVTKAYMDASLEGRTPKGVAKALADTNQTLSGLPTTIDGVTGWSADDKILLTGQTDPIENGIWEVQATAWTRPDNFDTGSNAAGASIWIDAGTVYDNQRWVCITNTGSAVVDTNELTWEIDGGTSNINTGTGFTKDGNTINIGDGTTGNVSGINRTADDIAAAVDDTTIEIAANVLAVKNLGISEAKLAATSVTAAKLGTDVAGDGLTGGNGAAIAADPDTTGGANLASAINVSANGVAVKVDDSTIGENASNQLEVKDAGITETQLNASVAGVGLTGGAGSALGLDIDSLTAEATVSNADTIAIFDDSAGAIRKMTRANFVAGLSTGTTQYQEAHQISAGEVSSGYFTLANVPTTVREVTAFVSGGPPQVNKQALGAVSDTADFDILSTNQFHFNNSGAATGLSEDLSTDDIVYISYTY